MKTGTTSLQNAASSLRSQLLSHGVRYPGETLNHRSAVNDFMGHSWGWGTTPVAGAWRRVRKEIDQDSSSRIWLCHEFGANADDETARRWREELGPSSHVAVTLRNFGSLLPSVWQQTTKEGDSWHFEPWLEEMLSDDPSPEVRSFASRHDQGQVVRRWAEAFGAENVTVIVVDKSVPSLLFDTFEAMLALPAGVLQSAKLDGRSSNRGLSLDEAEFLRTVNETLRESLTWHEYCKWLRDPVASAVLSRRKPGPSEASLTLPDWAADRAHEKALAHVDAIRASGVRVVGDLGALEARARSATHPQLASHSLPHDAAAEAVFGLIRQGRREEARLRVANQTLKAAKADLSQQRVDSETRLVRERAEAESRLARERAHLQSQLDGLRRETEALEKANERLRALKDVRATALARELRQRVYRRLRRVWKR